MHICDEYCFHKKVSLRFDIKCFMKKTALLVLTLLLIIAAQAQQRDRLAELNVLCLNAFVTYTSVAPDGTLWMATHCG